MTTPNVPGGGSPIGSTIAALFSDRGSAQRALTQLHDAGFRNVWLGVTHGDASTTGASVASGAPSGGGGIMDSLGRFFSGEGSEDQALHKALISHGLSYEQAQRLEATVPAGAAIVTVDVENDPDEAYEILKANNGVLENAEKATVNPTAASQDTSADARRLQLREERLLIDKQRVASGEARIRKEVVSQQQSVDVPLFHEELFIQRRAVADGQTSTTPIGVGEEIRVPLTEEQLNVSKRTVVTEEVEIGKRKVEEVEHVTDTVRHEELRVDDDTIKPAVDQR